ncbi:MAG: 30S ribosome-binding factor RbfA [Propionibacteriaceae bacterium]|jgi:ribosome-binding factor A|nr:30S ribosome-binding factor RbfA [Propionibacteriaceae bacterium]
MANPTAAKVAEQIKTIAAQMLQRRIDDPRLGFLTITGVRLSKDWHRCELFYTVLGDPTAWSDAAAALEQAKGQIRTQVSRQLKLRFAPEIVFVADAMPEQSSHIEELLAQVRARDAAVAGQAAGASYAGEADPYKSTASATSPASPASPASPDSQGDFGDR